ncbi:hypothetical protein DLAC_08694 [Tieghemostelium lacteum]|uniref:Uncharacterized protein n=1 Tax=Tieghemostelium lacteum TaxID=361077 RepID=A0A151Z830_TIELA|nr:hypothetical protein DLAC_08694 [Tieghemostelium lacteum]|eukprot:KYQ90110.1 hypothetical protein DLAC_08694 [Tieghemostelium lacteum]
MLEDKLKYLKNLRVQIGLLTIVGWAVGMAIDRTYVNKYRVRADGIFANIPPLNPLVRDEGDKAALIILSIIETLLFGLGIGFFIAVGFRVFQIKNKMLKKRMIWCWACISYFMVSWWPHSTAHSLIMVSAADPTDNYIAIEIAFHWTIMFCSLTLAYFQYDLILLMYEVAMMRLKMKEGREVDPLKKEWYRNFKYHSLIVLAIMFAVGMIVAFHYDPISDSMRKYQIFFYITFKIIDSVILGCGFAFLYIIVWIITPLPNNNGKRVSIISSACIFFLFLIQFPHPLIHNKSPASMKNVIAIDYGVHIPIIIATTVLAFYQFRMLELATDAKSSLSVAAQMRRKKDGTSSTGDVTMKSLDGTGAQSSSSIGVSGASNEMVSNSGTHSSGDVDQKEQQTIGESNKDLISSDITLEVKPSEE